MRTYYGFQHGWPTFPGEMDVITTAKPRSRGYQVKVRATNTSKARKLLNQKWNNDCQRALQEERLPWSIEILT